MRYNVLQNRHIKQDRQTKETKMNTYKILGHNIYSDKWEDLGVITSTSSRGANQKAHNQYGLDYSEFLISIAK